MKKCSKCGLHKQLKDYYKRKTGLRSGEYYEKCKDCYRIRGRNYYNDNRERQLALAKKRKLKYIEERKIFLEKIKDKPCLDCGKKYPAWVMDFDHRNGHEKTASISFLAFRKLANFDKIRDEIAKCDLVCSNCHRERTYKRLQKAT